MLGANLALNSLMSRVTDEPSAAGSTGGTADLFHAGDVNGARRLLRQSSVAVVVEMHGSRWDDRPATTKRFRSLLRELGRTAVPISAQEDAFADCGTVALVRS